MSFRTESVAKPAVEPPLPDFSTDCLFLDYDGTIVEITDRPAKAVPPEATIAILTRIERRLGTALAIITGRNIADVDIMLAPLRLPIAGVHGLTRRSAAGRLEKALIDQGAVCSLARDMSGLVETFPGLALETKWGAVALHYRARPELANVCIAALETAALSRSTSAAIIHGKMVVEAKFAHRTKGTAVAQFMREPPFAGRRPVFVGDDLTDEDGFAMVRELGGISAKVGFGPSIAQYRFDAPPNFLAWLEAAAAQPTEHIT